jgi:glycosyltransferase involved in cell wall biosynthesis
LETAISALPAVVERHPDVRYVIAGATHPEVVRQSGEEYRRSLIALASELRITAHVRFVDAFLSEADIAALLAGTDLYLTPYRSPDQTCSGPLTFALAAGCPVVSTSYRYAMDLVTPPDAPARGALVPFDDPAAFAAAITELLGDPERLTEVRESARKLGTELTWPAVGARFASMFADAAPPSRIRSAVRLRPVGRTSAAGGEPVWSYSQQPPASANPAP